LVVLGVAFWLGLAVDWTFEPSPAVRRFALIGLALAVVYIAYRYLLRRLAVRIADSSAATLLERRFPELNEHVQTTADVAASPVTDAGYHSGLVHATQQAAVHALANIRTGELFDRRSLFRAVTVASVLVASVALFALGSPGAFNFWLERIGLSNELWPRRVRLEVVGFTPDAAGKRAHKLAQDDDYELVVRADAKDYEVPEEVEIRFRLGDGRRGRDTMIRVGEAGTGEGDFQLYRYEFKRVAGDMTFDVVGGDDRVHDLQLRVVDRPELYAIELECIYPNYLGRASRRLPVTGGMRIPEGTRLIVHANATKPLTAARIHASQRKADDVVPFSDKPQKELRWEYGTLADDDVLLVSVTDTDDVASREPYRISLAVVRDEVPQVAVRLSGIGTAITGDAILPVTGKITDDYSIDRAWFEYRVGEGQVATRPLSKQSRGEPLLETIDAFDTRAADPATGRRALELRPGQRLTVSLKAADRFNLSDAPRAGSSQQFTLDVVTMADLLAIIERREFTLRQQFEAIYEKVTDTRNLLSRVDSNNVTSGTEDSATSAGNGQDQADAGEPTDNASATSGVPQNAPTGDEQRALARRRLRVAGSLQNILQSADEITGVAEAFDDLHDQLTNNRIDNPDLKSRLREQIALPLHRIGQERMPELSAQLKLVEEHLQDEAGPAELAKAVTLADEVLVEMKQVLDRMRELENYNEVVSLLRDIISDQDEINRQTKERQKSRLRNLFEDGGE
jgi:hypothetical protein